MPEYKCAPLHFRVEQHPDGQKVFLDQPGVPTYCKMTPAMVDTLGTTEHFTRNGDEITIKVENAHMTYTIVDKSPDGDYVCQLAQANRKRDKKVIRQYRYGL